MQSSMVGPAGTGTGRNFVWDQSAVVGKSSSRSAHASWSTAIPFLLALWLLCILASVFAGVAIGSILTGNNIAAYFALGPAVAALFGLAGIQWRIVNRSLRNIRST